MYVNKFFRGADSLNKVKVLKEINDRLEMYNLFLRAAKKARAEKATKVKRAKKASR